MSAPIVQISDGKVKGTSLTDSNGENFHSFLSIPFGKAPVGHLRFKAPQPVDPWEGVKDATKQGDCNYQADIFTGKLEGSEDSLNLHVFTKKLPSEEKRLKPVLFYIHGGGFIGGTHDFAFLGGPEHLMTEDVVVVFTTYRQGILGYLSLQDTSLDVPGNAGLKDLVLALKWVHKNIQDFNGDPNNVTIFGESAGGAAVEYLVLSPSAKNLFHKAIAMSGFTLCPWVRNKFDPIDFCKYLGYPDLTEKEALEVLTEISVEDLYQAQIKYQALTDSQFIIAGLTSALNLSKTSKYKVYSYRFAFSGTINLMRQISNVDYKGASHGDDMSYLFKPHRFQNVEVGAAEKLTTKRLVKLWTNFAKYGNPTPKDNDLKVEWKPVQEGNFNFLHIGDELVPSVDPYPDALKFWKEVFQMDPSTAKYL